jgi:hypothetical protein
MMYPMQPMHQQMQQNPMVQPAGWYFGNERLQGYNPGMMPAGMPMMRSNGW